MTHKRKCYKIRWNYTTILCNEVIFSDAADILKFVIWYFWQEAERIWLKWKYSFSKLIKRFSKNPVKSLRGRKERRAHVTWTYRKKFGIKVQNHIGRKRREDNRRKYTVVALVTVNTRLNGLTCLTLSYRHESNSSLSFLHFFSRSSTHFFATSVCYLFVPRFTLFKSIHDAFHISLFFPTYVLFLFIGIMNDDCVSFDKNRFCAGKFKISERYYIIPWIYFVKIEFAFHIRVTSYMEWKIYSCCRWGITQHSNLACIKSRKL